MVVVVTRDVIRLDQPEDCQGFKVVVEEGTANQVMQALAHVGRMADHDTAWIRADAIRMLADGRVGPGWADDFDAMSVYAATKGWLSDDRTEIRAHIEWPP